MQFGQLRRREFITLLGGGVATWPLAAKAQQQTMPVGFLSSTGLERLGRRVAALRQGLADTGNVEGRNVAFELR
jgi:putative tryptophan/tyrosine transport system substrate-binding protein